MSCAGQCWCLQNSQGDGLGFKHMGHSHGGGLRTRHNVKVVLEEGGRGAAHPDRGAAAKHRPEGWVGLVEAGCAQMHAPQTMLIEQMPADEPPSKGYQILQGIRTRTIAQCWTEPNGRPGREDHVR